MIKLCLYANGRQLIKEKEEKSANHWALTYLLNLNSYTTIKILNPYFEASAEVPIYSRVSLIMSKNNFQLLIMMKFRRSNCILETSLILINLEKCIGQDQVVDTIHSGICFKLRVNVKEYLPVWEAIQQTLQEKRRRERSSKTLDKLWKHHLQACQSALRGEDAAPQSKSIVFYWSRRQPERS